MTATEAAGRPNQRRRTRKDLLQAAARLMKQGRIPTIEDVAQEALVSRATAYRYFPTVEALMREAALDVAMPEPDHTLADVDSTDPVTRLERVDGALHEFILENETALRMMLAHAIEQGARQDDDGTAPRRQNRRVPMIEAAVDPARERFTPAALDRLTHALALIIGPEAVVVGKDVLQLDDSEMREVKRFAINALVTAALKDG
ncbi:TetR/AcrR family transcriptional regulator [Mycobacterium sp. GA-2829]|uniref:TetR/AcrR family transcriptional regulator n=1 Tax=Mycobacterium sp. GA-2829 TaxID=1772283 RepID=UPI00074025C4|nr:TetR/AcrR family transcriptional regulator [Mycobacterium sp. GA-2829]KUI38305.1 TetR family transcriptional regulator [Mycobacterium sp. GA-2829]